MLPRTALRTYYCRLSWRVCNNKMNSSLPAPDKWSVVAEKKKKGVVPQFSAQAGPRLKRGSTKRSISRLKLPSSLVFTISPPPKYSPCLQRDSVLNLQEMNSLSLPEMTHLLKKMARSQYYWCQSVASGLA